MISAIPAKRRPPSPMAVSTYARAARSIASPSATSIRMIQNPESSTEADPLIGRTIAHYTIQSKLGWDAAGVIYQARDNEAAKEIIFKTFHPHVAADAVRMQRFEHDAMAVSALKHSNIARVHGFSEVDAIR